jgi:hypothetical protein
MDERNEETRFSEKTGFRVKDPGFSALRENLGSFIGL